MVQLQILEGLTMRQIFNRSNFAIVTGIVLLFAVIILSPKDIYAIEANSPQALAESNNAAIKTSPFCTNLATESAKVKANLTELSSKLSAAWVQQGATKTTDWQQVDQKVSANRAAADAKLIDSLTKLAEKATSDNQKQAITDYAAAVNAALTTRRNDTDNARITFRNAVNNLMASRQETVTAQLNTFIDSVDTAIATAKDVCTSDPTSGVATHKIYQDSLAEARTTFQNNRSGNDKIKTELTILSAARDDNFKTIDAAFKASMTAAKTTLQTTLNNTSI